MNRHTIRAAQLADSARIAEIYNQYIVNTVVTCEDDEVSGTEMELRNQETQTLELPWLVVEDDGKVLGYVYASKWKGRCAYRFSVETTVYLAHDASGEGVGTRLYERLFAELKRSSYHRVIGGITLPNPTSVALHEKFGMRKVGHFDEVGFKFGQWLDVGYWQGALSVLDPHEKQPS